MERDEPVGRIVSHNRGVTPDVAEIDSAEGDAAGPDGAEAPENRAQHVPEGDGGSVRREVIEQVAGAGRGVAEPFGARAQRIPERTQQRDPPFESRERIPVIDLEHPRYRFLRHPRESAGIGPKGLRGFGGKRALGEQVQARDAETLGPRELQSGAGLLPPPGRPGAGVEEHADDREVEPDARPLGAVDAVEQRRDPIDAAGLEMPPAAVKRDIERRVVAPHLAGDIVGGGAEPVFVEHEMREGAARARVEHLAAAFANGPGTEERCRRGVKLHGSSVHRSR